MRLYFGQEQKTSAERRSTAARWVIGGAVCAGIVAATWKMKEAWAQASQEAPAEADPKPAAAASLAPVEPTQPAPQPQEPTPSQTQPPVVTTPPVSEPSPTPAPPVPQEDAAHDLDAGDDLRAHDFPAPTPPDNRSEEDVTVNQDQMAPEEIVEGGLPGEVEGDRQNFGEVPTIMDQDEATPDFAQEH